MLLKFPLRDLSRNSVKKVFIHKANVDAQKEKSELKIKGKRTLF